MPTKVITALFTRLDWGLLIDWGGVWGEVSPLHPSREFGSVVRSPAEFWAEPAQKTELESYDLEIRPLSLAFN